MRGSFLHNPKAQPLPSLVGGLEVPNSIGFHCLKALNKSRINCKQLFSNSQKALIQINIRELLQKTWFQKTKIRSLDPQSLLSINLMQKMYEPEGPPCGFFTIEKRLSQSKCRNHFSDLSELLVFPL